MDGEVKDSLDSIWIDYKWTKLSFSILWNYSFGFDGFTVVKHVKQ